MGYDCTLHVIDPASIAKFVERFNELSNRKAAFDNAFDNADERFDEARDKARTADKKAGRHLLQLCLRWCSADTPHLPSRDFALSLWSDSELGVDVPRHLLEDSLAPMLQGIVDRYPSLKHDLYLGFDGNWSVGPFVLPDKVPELLAFVLGMYNDVPPRLQRMLEPLVLVLTVARDKKLAYWEATDIDVANGKATWLKEPKGQNECNHVFSVPSGHTSDMVAFDNDRIVISGAHPDNTWVVDCSATPPKVAHFPDFFAKNGFIDADRLLAIGRYRHKDPYCVYELALEPSGVPTKVPIEKEIWLSDLARVSGDILLAPSPSDEPPHWIRGGRLEPTTLPPCRSHDEAGFEATPFGDGTTLVVWKHKPYRFVEGVFEALPIESMVPNNSGFVARQQRYTDDNGDVVTLDDRKLVRVSRTGERTEVAPLIHNIMQLVRGPDDALLLYQGDTLEEDVAKILWPNGDLIRLKFSDFGVKGLSSFAWSPSMDAVLVLSGQDLIATPWRSLLKKPRLTSIEWEAQLATLKQKEASRKRALWQKSVENRRATPLPTSPEEFHRDDSLSGVCRKQIVSHPEYGPGIVLEKVVKSSMSRIEEQLVILFEAGERKLTLIRRFDGAESTLTTS